MVFSAFADMLLLRLFSGFRQSGEEQGLLQALRSQIQEEER